MASFLAMRGQSSASQTEAVFPNEVHDSILASRTEAVCPNQPNANCDGWRLLVVLGVTVPR